MSRTFVLWAANVLGILLGPSCAALDSQREDEILRSLAEAGRGWAERARQVLDSGGADAIPVVMRFALEKGDLDLQDYIYVRFGREERRALPAYSWALRHPDREIRRCALAGLRRLGFRMPECVPVLLEALRDSDVGLRRSAAAGLVMVARGSFVPAELVLEALQDSDEGLRLLVLAAIAARAPDDPGWIALLANLVRTAEPRVASLAARALGGYGSLAATAVGALVAGLDREVVCANAAEALSEMGESARGAIPALKRILASGRRIVPAFDPWVDSFDAVTDEGDLRVFDVAEQGQVGGEASVLRALRCLGDDFLGVESEVIELCRSGVAACQHEAALALLTVAPRLRGKSALRAAHALLDMAAGEVVTLSSIGTGAGIAALALARLEDGAKAALSEAIRGAGTARAVVALYALARLGPQAAELASDVRGATDDPRALVRLAALVAMKRIEPRTPAIGKLLEICDHMELEWEEWLREHARRVRGTPSRWELHLLDQGGPLGLCFPSSPNSGSLPWLLGLAMELCGPEVRESEDILWESLGKAPCSGGILHESPGGIREPRRIIRAVVSARLLAENSVRYDALVETARTMAPGIPGGVELICTLAERAEREGALRASFAGVLSSLLNLYGEENGSDEDRLDVASLILAERALKASEPVGRLLLKPLLRIAQDWKPLEYAGRDFWGYEADAAPRGICEFLAVFRGVEPQLARELERVLQETPCDQLRRWILWALAEWPQKDPITMEAVRPFLESGDTLVRALAARAFIKSGGDPEAVLSVLEEVVKTRWAARRFDAAQLIGVHDVNDGVVWYGSLGIFNYVHHVALRTLGDLGSKARKALPIVRGCLSGPDPVARLLAVEALWRIQGEVHLDIVIDDLRQWPRWVPNWPTWEASSPMLDSEPWLVERATEACRVLGELGTRAAEALGILEELGWIPGSVGVSAREALARIGATREGPEARR